MLRKVVVTRFNTTAFPKATLWGGFVIQPASIASQVISAFVNLENHVKDDTAANMNNFWVYHQSAGTTLLYAGIDYTKPTPSPPIYNQYLSIQPTAGNSLRVVPLKSFTDEVDAATGQNERYVFVTATFQLSAEMYQNAADISSSYLEPRKSTAGLVWATLTNPFQKLRSRLRALREVIY